MKSKSDKAMILMKKNNMKWADSINYMTNSCLKQTTKARILWKISWSIWFDKLKNFKKTAISFTGNGLRSKQFLCMKTISFSSSRIQSKIYKTKRQSWTRKSPDLTTIIVPFKNKSRKFKSVSKDFNNKWINLMIISQLIVTKSLNSKMKTSISSQSSLKNLKKWKDKPSSCKSISIKSEKKKQN